MKSSPSNSIGADLPQGLSSQLARDPQAMETYNSMSVDQRSALLGYVRGAATGADAKNRIADAMSQLHNSQITF